jgi:exosortase family protein XrtG
MSLTGILVPLAFIGWVAALAVLWSARRWLIFYSLGALGLIVFVMIVASFTGWDNTLEAFEARQVLMLARPLGLTLVVLGSNGLAIRNHTGWGVFDIGVECSALMEMTAMAGLLLFYPAVFRPARKAVVVVVGVIMTYLFNLGRVLLIVAIVARMGTDWVFPAHAVFGRLFFFVVTIALFWQLVTRPTVAFVGDALRPSPAVAPAGGPVEEQYPADAPGISDEQYPAETPEPAGAFDIEEEPEPETGPGDWQFEEELQDDLDWDEE